MASSTSTVTVKVDPVLSPEFEALLGTATEATLEKLDAGAQLVYALYHCSAEVITGLPDPVHRAIMRAQVAYNVGHRRQRERVEPVVEAASTDPVRYVER